ncbi:MAG: CRISPR-associated helicase/endonuclease Cas3 [Syntrophales bacterium]|nr:CRISPR-associated helicase/endonuclease Cas3 [Syntrophales bacterium]
MKDSVPSYFKYWGKANPDYPYKPKYHPLVYHCLDVAAVAAVWWDTSSVIRMAFLNACGFGGLVENAVLAWMLFFVAIHDLGKLDVRYQLKSEDAHNAFWPELNPGDVIYEGQYDHGRGGLGWADLEHADWFHSDYEIIFPWIEAVTGHHGEFMGRRYDTFGKPIARENVLLHDRNARREFIKEMQRVFLSEDLIQAGPPSLIDPAGKSLFGGFCSVSDWIGSNANFFHYRERGVEAWEYFAGTREYVKKGNILSSCGLLRDPMPYSGVKSLLKEKEKPRGIQKKIDDLPIVPSLMLIEASTGSGKTEAAVAYAWKLLDHCMADSIVFALPTQASANAMLERVERFAEIIFGKGANVVLAHGKRDYNPKFRKLVEIAVRNNVDDEEASVQCAEWIAQSRKRVFLGQIGVCTIDQVLLSVLPVRHKFVRGFGINKSVLIVDEIHAYDSYMHGILSEVISRQRKMGASVILLSATLPSNIRNEIFKLWNNTEVKSDRYPQLTHVPIGEKYKCKTGPAKKHGVKIELVDSPGTRPDLALRQRVIDSALRGAKTALIMNFVDDAQKTAKELSDSAVNATSVPVDVFHARFRLLDRMRIEEKLHRLYGRNSEPGGRILVATQVLEQSVDLDSDWMITQICPGDLFFQRLGRLHRHKRKRPEFFKDALCTILIPSGGDYGLHQKIYKNVLSLWRTEQLLRNNKDKPIEFPRAYRRWIEAVYGKLSGEEPDSIQGDYYAFRDWQENRKNEALRLTGMSISEYRDDISVINSLTRGEEMGLVVIPVLSGHRFLDGSKIRFKDLNTAELMDLNSIPAPTSWRDILRDCDRDDEGRFFLEMGPDGSGQWAGEIGKFVLRYSEDFGLEKG